MLRACLGSAPRNQAGTNQAPPGPCLRPVSAQARHVNGRGKRDSRTRPWPSHLLCAGGGQRCSGISGRAQHSEAHESDKGPTITGGNQPGQDKKLISDSGAYEAPTLPPPMVSEWRRSMGQTYPVLVRGAIRAAGRLRSVLSQAPPCNIRCSSRSMRETASASAWSTVHGASA